MKKETKRPSLGDIARLAGVSAPAVSLALQNKPRVSPPTRTRILRIAKELGYTPDPRIGSWMAQVRGAKSKDLLPIAWLNTSEEADAWHRYSFQSPSLEGASARALELGYQIQEVWSREPGMTMRRLSRILYERGIEGVIVTQPARHLRLDWDHLASVHLGGCLQAPRLHRVMPDILFNLALVLKSLKRLGYTRIGICVAQEIDTTSDYSVHAVARDLYFSRSSTERILPLFHSRFWSRVINREKDTKEWLKRQRPEVIVGHDNRLEQWVKEAGFRVPEDIGIVHLAVDDDVLDWAGIHSRRRQMGATAVEWLVSLMRYRQFGVPKVPLKILIEGSWQDGRTLATSPTAKTQPAAPRKTGRIAKARSLPR